MIDVDRTFKNEYGRLTVSTLGISIHHSIFNIKLERVNERGWLKL